MPTTGTHMLSQTAPPVADAVLAVRAEGGELRVAEDDELALWVFADEDVDPEIQATAARRYGPRERWRCVAELVALRRVEALRRHRFDHSPADPVLESILSRMGPHLERFVANRDLRRLGERDELHPSFARAAVEELGHEAVRARLGVRASSWPGLAPADVTLLRDGRRPTVLELTCGHGLNALGECVWDAAKAALLLQEGVAAGAFLVAAARREDWERPVRGSEFFADAVHDTELLRVLYGDWWRMWEEGGEPQPSELPHRWRTRAVASTSVEVAGVEWIVRAAEVLVDDRRRLTWRRRATDHAGRVRSPGIATTCTSWPARRPSRPISAPPSPGAA
jgi:hypothetical protein